MKLSEIGCSEGQAEIREEMEGKRQCDTKRAYQSHRILPSETASKSLMVQLVRYVLWDQGIKYRSAGPLGGIAWQTKVQSTRGQRTTLREQILIGDLLNLCPYRCRDKNI
jgi:hypothetical protein